MNVPPESAGGREAKGEGNLSASALKVIAEQRKKALRDSDASLSENSEDGEEGESKKMSKRDRRRQGGGILQEIKNALKDIGDSFSKSFMDYGPPYYPQDSENETLVDLCSQMFPNVIKIHTLLNRRADPNERDPEDFYFAAIHYCARYSNLLVMRMLRAAGGDVNILNEFGQSPLSMCCMDLIPEHDIHTHDTQLKMFDWLVREGADIHNRDRAGLEPLDYCAMNNDMEKIIRLLTLGAKVRRDNYLLTSATKKNILKYVSDPDVYRVLNEALQAEEEGFQGREAAKEAVKLEEEREAGVQRNLRQLKKKKEKREENAKKAIEYDRLVAKLEMRKKNVALSMESLVEGKKAAAKMAGEYVRDDFGYWKWVAKDKADTADAISNNLYASSCATMRRLKETNKLSVYQERWSKMGGAGDLVLDWRRDAAFYTEGEEREVYKENDDGLDDDDPDENHSEDAEFEGDDLEDLLG